MAPTSVEHLNLAWRVSDIVYMSIMGVLFLMALLEWALWLLSWWYCLAKAYQKAEDWSVKVLVFIMGAVFTLVRLMFLPIMVVTLPLPDAITAYFPSKAVYIFQMIGFVSFLVMLTVPTLICLYHLITRSIGRSKRIAQLLDEHSAPTVLVVMPCYNELPEVLLNAIDSVADSDYPASRLAVYLSFDGDQQNELYLNTIRMLGVKLLPDFRYPSSLKIGYPNSRGHKVEIIVSRFKHGGKRKCQKNTFEVIQRHYEANLQRSDNYFLLFIDSDCILDQYCIQNLMYDMHLSPGNKRNMLAMTGVITSTTKSHSLLTLVQDIEYVHGQLMERTVESVCGTVTCLPGALTMLRLSALRKMAPYYFGNKVEHCKDMFDFGKCHLGEDRWLTHLLMIGAKKSYQIQMCTSAFCKTEAVQTFSSLTKQRRRWFLGFITNEVCMMTDIRIWRKYTALCVLRLLTAVIRTTSFLFFTMMIALMTTSKNATELPLQYMAISYGLLWLFMSFFALKMGRYKLFLYPLMAIINPFFNWYYLVNAVFTAGQRTWGGPRADAGKADATNTPEAVVERAEKLGDDLNIVPETFVKDDIDAVPLQPPGRIEGRFTAAELLPNGLYRQSVPSMLDLGGISSLIELGGQRIQRGYSFDSNDSILMPRRVESIMGEEDRKKYTMAKEVQRSTSFNIPRGRVFELNDAELGQKAYDHFDSLASGESLPDPRSSRLSSFSSEAQTSSRSSSRHGQRRSAFVGSPLAQHSWAADESLINADRGLERNFSLHGRSASQDEGQYQQHTRHIEEGEFSRAAQLSVAQESLGVDLNSYALHHYDSLGDIRAQTSGYEVAGTETIDFEDGGAGEEGSGEGGGGGRL